MEDTVAPFEMLNSCVGEVTYSRPRKRTLWERLWHLLYPFVETFLWFAKGRRRCDVSEMLAGMCPCESALHIRWDQETLTWTRFGTPWMWVVITPKQTQQLQPSVQSRTKSLAWRGVNKLFKPTCCAETMGRVWTCERLPFKFQPSA